MAEGRRHLTQISVDLKKYRVRVHKESLRLIGDPSYIQFLVNVEKRQVAIRAVPQDTSGSQSHKVNRSRLKSDFSYEIYSRPFIDKLRREFDCFRDGSCYRLTGVVIPEEKAAVFPISTILPIESEGQGDG